jgi:hypothetical protein
MANARAWATDATLNKGLGRNPEPFAVRLTTISYLNPNLKSIALPSFSEILKTYVTFLL